jgi:hypothetical protein
MLIGLKTLEKEKQRQAYGEEYGEREKQREGEVENAVNAQRILRGQAKLQQSSCFKRYMGNNTVCRNIQLYTGAV